MRVDWSDGAFADIERLDAFLRPKSPRAADEAFFVISQAASQLEIFPEIGKPAAGMPVGYRELLVPFSTGGYVILYHISRSVRIVRVRHQREHSY